MGTQLNSCSDNPPSLWMQQSIHVEPKKLQEDDEVRSLNSHLEPSHNQAALAQAKTAYTSQDIDPTQSYMPWMWLKTTPRETQNVS